MIKEAMFYMFELIRISMPLILLTGCVALIIDFNYLKKRTDLTYFELFCVVLCYALFPIVLIFYLIEEFECLRGCF